MAHPQLVGNSFVGQYYNVLHQSPHVVHRFYTDSSSLTRAEAGPEGHAETVFSQSGIHEKVMSMDYAGMRAEIKTVDCQDSYSGSVLVMVTGSLSSRSNERRDFVQTFFLAPQAKGYFVLNDIFRYLGEPNYAMPMQEHSPTPESAVSDPAHMEVSESVAPEEEEQQHIDEGYDIIPQHEDVEEEVPVEETVQAEAVAVEAEEVVDLDDGQRDQPKKSYASIASQLRLAKDGYAHHHVSPAPKSLAEKPVSPSPRAAPLPSPALPPPMESVDETEAHVDVKAIYIKNLPMSITVPQLDEEFQRYGAVKAGFTNIKKNPNVCYAFLEFEDVASARAALQASPIQIMGKGVFVEEKRPLAARGGGGFRGRGRGRTDGVRGRGGYYGGRGNTGGRVYEGPLNRGGRGRGGNANSGSGEETAYQPRYDNNNHNHGSSSSSGNHSSGNAGGNINHNSNNQSNNNSSGSGNNNSGSSSGYANGPRSARRGFYKNNSYGRSGGGGNHPAPAAVTAA